MLVESKDKYLIDNNNNKHLIDNNKQGDRHKGIFD
jgi:hypothetical protein